MDDKSRVIKTIIVKVYYKGVSALLDSGEMHNVLPKAFFDRFRITSD